MDAHDLQARMRSGFGKFGGRLAVLFMVLGFVAIGVGWNGAASDPRLPAQFPYLLSGGIAGLGLIMVGAALIVIQAYREERTRLELKLDELITAVSRAGGVGGGGSAAPRDLAGLVAAGSASYHAPGCRLVDGREEVDYLTPEEARARSLQPCRVCQPEPSNVTVR